MAYAVKIDGSWQQIAGAFTVLNGEEPIQYPPNWPELATPEERTMLGVYEIVDAPAEPENVQVLGLVLGEVNGGPGWVWQTQPYDAAGAGALMWSRAKDYRDTFVTSGCVVPTPAGLGRVDTDSTSQTKLTAATAAAFIAKSLGQAFSVDWTMAGDSVVKFNGDQTIAMGMAVVAFMDASQKASNAIRSAIDQAVAAGNVPAIFAIDVTAGYPPAA